MSVEENKAITRRWNEELINRGNVDILDELADVHYVYHGIGDREAFKQYAAALRAVFSDWRITIEDMIAEGDRVVIRWIIDCTHTGAYMGVPATNKPVTMSGVSIYRIENGKVMEDWAFSDEVGVMRQLGVLPPAG